MTILNCDIQLYKKRLAMRKIIAILAVALTVILNVLFSVFRSDETHVAFLAINIISDIACGWFLIAWYQFAISNQRKILSLATAKKELTQTVRGNVVAISDSTQVVSQLQCYKVTVEGNETRVIFVVENCGITLERGVAYNITTADNIAISAEVDQ